MMVGDCVLVRTELQHFMSALFGPKRLREIIKRRASVDVGREARKHIANFLLVVRRKVRVGWHNWWTRSMRKHGQAK